jgi:hypothetical protein
MRILQHRMSEELAIRLLGWKWVSFVGLPVKSSDCYPANCRVRQLFSAKQLNSEDWQQFFRDSEGADATGDEPLAYSYCSSQGDDMPLPRFIILLDEGEA